MVEDGEKVGHLTSLVIPRCGRVVVSPLITALYWQTVDPSPYLRIGRSPWRSTDRAVRGLEDWPVLISAKIDFGYNTNAAVEETSSLLGASRLTTVCRNRPARHFFGNRYKTRVFISRATLLAVYLFRRIATSGAICIKKIWSTLTELHLPRCYRYAHQLVVMAPSLLRLS